MKQERLAELEEKLAGEYVGGMTEYWQRQKDFLLSEKGEEVADVLDGPNQECYPLEQVGPWYPRPDPDDETKPDVEHITNPSHGGKVTCHTCSGFIIEGKGTGYLDHQHPKDFPSVWFHTECYNPYEHYYGIDKPID